MRVLLGPLNRRDHRAVAEDLDGLDVRLFDRAHADCPFDPAREPLEALWRRLPADWRPDLLVWWSPEYALVPEGIERCPVPSVAAVGDWNLGLWTTAPLLEAFDLVVTDRPGVRVLAPQLAVPVERWPLFSFDRRLHRPDPATPRDIDVLFVGNLNPDVHAERLPWLARLARLSDRRRVLIASGVYGPAYAALLRRARIVWNRSIRGELNMRAYEAAASGALLLMEADNLEVREVFADGVSCALYDAATLERVVAAYLDEPRRLAAVAEAGWRRVQTETYRDHVVRLLALARPLRVGPRPFGALPAWRRAYWLGLHALATPDRARVEAALAHFRRAAAEGGERGALAAALGATAAVAAEVDGADRARTLGQAAQLLALAVEAERDDAVSWANLAWVHALRGALDDARRAWATAHALLAEEAPFPVDRVPLPTGYDGFRVAWERAALAADLDARRAAFRGPLVARVAAGLARLDRAGGLGWWAESVAACPGVDGNGHGLARALAEAGEPEAAAEAWARLLERNPFDEEARTAAATLARARGDEATVTRLVDDAAALARACDRPPEALGAAATGSPR